MRSARDGALALAEALRAEGGTAASVLRDPTPAPARSSDPGPAQRSAAGPRAAGHEAEYELLLEMINEGSRLHYGSPRVLADDDADLALLLGDQLYARGLSRLAELGDLESVAELADLISLVAQAHASGQEELAVSIWEAGATAVGWGPSAEHETAKALARAGDGDAMEALRRAAERSGS
jgi:hypothetical protein